MAATAELLEEQKYILLEMLKTDLGILSATVYDERLLQYLTAARAEVIQEGAASLDGTVPRDAQLIVDYAAWLWRKRDSMEAMPRGLRYRLNCRVLGEKARPSDG